MNDVLPKPFTKEGLLTMLEKHLRHLKDTRPSSDNMPPHQMAQLSGRPMLKDDSSSVKSETITNWQSPTTQITGISPTSHNMNEEFVTALSRGGPYSLDVSAHPDALNFSSERAIGPPRPALHRRQISQISDVSASDEQQNDAKRQRLLSPAQATRSIG